ncbi:unnamed protein product [Enterobius vermicularis]|uniref:C2H2-type domain-containing protein n=1 Tax=Enterobius vermicularis TaxID=51028 RepID=A0A0N4VKJ7_ENTVE|nr:unnamed protein product [Enterobius vermicularis]
MPHLGVTSSINSISIRRKTSAVVAAATGPGVVVVVIVGGDGGVVAAVAACDDGGGGNGGSSGSGGYCVHKIAESAIERLLTNAGSSNTLPDSTSDSWEALEAGFGALEEEERGRGWRGENNRGYSSPNIHASNKMSDGHIYRYRCSQCSLAFGTQERLAQHTIYHAFRTTYRCPQCSRSFTSADALQKHTSQEHINGN